MLNKRKIALMLSGFFIAKSTWSLIAVIFGFSVVIPEINLTIEGDLNLAGFFINVVLAYITYTYGIEEPKKNKRKSKSRRKRK